MTLTELAPLIVPAATAIAVLVPVLGSAGKTNERLKSIELIMLQLLLHDEHLPISERLKAGKKYLDLGGNGASAVYHKELEKKYEKLVGAKMEGG